jgi:RND superfamily putative drug exporter
MFRRLGQGAVTYPWLVVGVWLLLGLGLSLVAPAWDARTQDDDIHFLPDRCPSVRGYHLLEKAFPQDVFASRLLFVLEREEAPLTDADFALVDQLVEALEQLRRQAPELKISSICSYQDGLIGSRLISPDRQCTLIQVSLGTPYLALQTQTTVTRAEQVVRARLAAAGVSGLRLFTSGAAGLGRDLTKSYGDSLDHTTLATVVLVVVVLLLVYRAPLLALVPLATIAVSVWVALKILALLTLIPGVHLVNISKIFAIVILYGAGTDYCLFLISRYREELEAGREWARAAARAVAEVGGALTASAGTVACGLGLMGLSEFAKVRYAGPGIALSLVVALAATLTLTPALLCLLGKAVFWPCSPPAPATLLARSQRRRRDLWQRLSQWVAARPLLVWCLASVALLPLLVIGFQVTPSYRPTSQLSPSSESLQGLTALERHFTAGEVGPLTVLLASPDDWDSTLGRLQIDHLSRGFARLPNVAEVRSLTQPLGRPLPGTEASGTPSLLEQLLPLLPGDFLQRFLEEARQLTRQHYVAVLPKGTAEGRPLYVTRLDLILHSDPFDPASIATLRQVQAWLNHELPLATFAGRISAAEVYGVMVNTCDLEQITESDRTRVNTLIVAGIFLILLALVRRPLLAAYLLLTVLASYYATLGATALANLLWGGNSTWQLDWRVLFFLFTILISVGEDYNILLLTRALQEAKHFGAYEGMRRALARTGGTISSCGLIMAGTFATLMLASLGALLQIGFALAFGVLLDTFLVRPFLVPAFTLLLARESATPAPAVRQTASADSPQRSRHLAASGSPLA